MQRIEAVMRNDSGGDIHKTGLEKALWSASLIYRSGAVLRRTLYRKRELSVRRLPVPVISVGNLAVGGTGKTPLTVHLASLLRRRNYRPAVISRGYGGSAEQTGMIVSNGETILADSILAGDEPLMMAKQLRGVPLLVGRNRYRSGMIAIEKFDCDTVILDDGYQHMELYRDLNIVLLDARNPLGNGHVLPRGILREPPAALVDAHALVFTRSPRGPVRFPSGIAPFINNLPTFNVRQKAYLLRGSVAHGAPQYLPLSDLNRKKVFLFSGIAQNDNFFQTVHTTGARIQGHATFGDHHRYSQTELENIIASANRTASELLLTTEKDISRIGPDIRWPLPFAVIGVNMSFHNDDFDHFVMKFLESVKNMRSREI